MSYFFLVAMGILVLVMILQVCVLEILFRNWEWFRKRSRSFQLSVYLASAMALAGVPMVYFRYRDAIDQSSWLRHLILYPYTVYVLTVFCVGLFLVIPIVFRALKVRVSPSSGFEPQRRDFLSTSGKWVFAIGAASFSYAAYGESNQVDINRYRARFGDLPQELDGLTIAQISDIHVGPYFSTDQLRETVETINGLNPSLVAVTGDIINHNARYIPEGIGVLDGLRSDLGTFVVPGNHDYYTGMAAMERELRRSRLSLLKDEVAKGGKLPDSLQIIGLDDPVSRWTQDAYFPQLKDLLLQCDPGSFRLLLAHRPGAFRQARNLDVHLTLAGHTHGGQCIFPFPGTRGISLARMGLTYSHGWYAFGGNQERRMYVNRGLGTIVAPVRINCRPEITLIQLEKGKTAAASGIEL